MALTNPKHPTKFANIQFFLIQNLITSLNTHILVCFYFRVDFHYLTLLNGEGGRCDGGVGNLTRKWEKGAGTVVLQVLFSC